jgi:hypothetical protein
MTGITPNNLAITKLIDLDSQKSQMKIVYTITFPVSGEEYDARQAYSQRAYDLKTYVNNGFFIGVIVNLGQTYQSPLQYVTDSSVTIGAFLWK